MRTVITSIVLVVCLTVSAIATPHPKPQHKTDDEGDLHAVRKAIAALKAARRGKLVTAGPAKKLLARLNADD